jgi:hypothetical protein
MVRKVKMGVVVAAMMLAGREAAAANSGRKVGESVSGTFHQLVLQQAANESWTISTSNLSPGSDTVLHVQDYNDLQGGFIAGNDDYMGGLSSNVVVPPVGYARVLRVIVRSYSQVSQGTCNLIANSSLGNGSSQTAVPFGGSKYPIGSVPWGTHVMTAERQGGAIDTVLLVVGGPNGDHSHAVGWDDDDGVGNMSFLHVNDTCTDCFVVVANYSSTETATANLYWDADAHGINSDADDLGASLEQVIGTSDSNVDTDQDGLLDAHEVFGVEVSNVAIKLATWGADPLLKDMFVEMDWKQCIDITNPDNCPTLDANAGQMGAGLTDANFQSAIVDPIKADFAPANVRLHFDTGRSNSNPSTWNDWGDWGGATMLGVGDGCGEYGNTPERAYMFHHAISYPPEINMSGRNCLLPGPYLNVRVNAPRIFTHETGHSLGIQHGGRPHKISINFKPHYVSLMNYLYQWNATFSPGTAPVQGLNPTSLEERIGLGSGWPSTDIRTSVLTKLRDHWCPVTPYSLGKCVNIDGNAGAGIPIGAVDWNRDGSYAATGTFVQGPVNVLDFMWKGKSTFANGTLKDPALAWVSVGGSFGDQLWILGRNGSNQLVWTRRARTAINAGCGSLTSFYDEGNYDCAGFGLPGTATAAPGPKVLSFAPAAAEYGAGTNKQILVVFQKTTGTVTSSLVTINDQTGNATFGVEVPLPGGLTATGDITAVKVSATEVRAYAPRGSGSGARLREWKYLNGTWTDLGDQQWSDGTDVVPTFGIGATRGFQDSSATSSTYGAIPTWPDNLIEFARKDNASPFRWSKVTFTCAGGSFGCVSGAASSWAGTGGAGLPPSGTQPRAAARPGLAYQKRSGQADHVGRFYMAINQGTQCSAPFGTPAPATPGAPLGCASMLIMTEGNLATGTPASRRLTWITPAHVLAANFSIGGYSLINDLTRDSNLRAAFTQTDGWGAFEPLADGIFNANLSDMNDVPYVSGALRAALCMDGGTWPGTETTPCALPPNLP